MNSRRVLSLVSVAAALSAWGASAQAIEYGTVVSSTPVIGQTSVGRVMFHAIAGPAMNGLMVEPGS